MAMDYGLCKGKRKDGKPCTMPVNKAEGGGYCEFHVVAAFNRAQRQNPLRNKTKGQNSSGNNGSGNISNGVGNNLRAVLRGNSTLGVREGPASGQVVVFSAEILEDHGMHRVGN